MGMQKMITVVFLSLLFLSGPAFTEMCGPESCGLICTEEESCLQDLEISCCCEPCCPQWSCDPGPATTCPQKRPDLGSPCISEGEQCDYGSQECCGQTYPEISMECTGAVWQGYYVDTLCVLGLAPPCPDETTTTSQPSENYPNPI